MLAEGRDPADWEYLNFASSVKPRWVDQGDGTYELHLLVSDCLITASLNILSHLCHLDL